jgi:predicted Zn finger-like uncharacterized protein
MIRVFKGLPRGAKGGFRVSAMADWEIMVSDPLTDRLLGWKSPSGLPRFAMLIVCPKCTTSYQVEPSSLGPGGRSVRCTRCQNLWFAAVPTVVTALAAIDDLDVIDSAPRMPSPDATPPSEADNPSDWEDAGLLPQESSKVVVAEEMAEQAEAEFSPAPASTAGIDLDGLSAEMEAQRAAEAAAADLVLAEVTVDEITMADAPPLVPPMEPGREADSEAGAAHLGAGEDIETYAARRAQHTATRRRRWAAPGLPAVILALIAANTILIGWRADVVRVLPQTASLYAAVGMPVNLRGLAFENVKMSKEVQDGVTVLVVEGSIVNVAAKAVAVPRLRLAVRSDDRNEIYTWTAQPTRSLLGPAETLAFRSRLASPPGEARDVLVRFFTRRDIVAGLR